VVPVEPTLTDAELHRRLVYGDESAPGEVYAVYGGLVRRVATRVTRSPAAAEDVAQEVFAQLWSRPYAFDARRGTLRTWLSMLAHRRAVDWVRGEARHRKDARADDAALQAVPDAAPGPDETVVDRERSTLLHTALAELPQPQREVIHLAYFAGRTYRQAAVELGIPEGTAKTRLRAALRSLAECEPCAAEAERLRETVRLLNGPRRPAPVDGTADGVLALALRSRPAAPRVARHAAPYAVAGLRSLLREVEGRGGWGTPVVHDWDVHATVAHLIAADEPLARHLGAARTPEPAGTERSGAEPAPWQDDWAARTAVVIAREHRRTPEGTVAGWSAQADALLTAPEAIDPERASRAILLMGVRLPVADHFVVRAFETWIHTDDIGRALGLAVPPPPDPQLWQLVRLAVRILGTASPVLFEVAGGGSDARWVLGSEDEPVRAELVLEPVDFCLLVGGRYPPGEVPRGATGDAAAIGAVLERAASLAWL
jgi:RNA polymerase sigma factor (sigma-70 family)